jgi:hypothetical protein
VPLGVPFGLVSAVRDLREDDRGVILLLIRAFTGVQRSWFVAPLLTVVGVLLRAVFAVVGVVAPRYCPASRGVIGDLTLRLPARAGINGRDGGGGGGGWVSRDLFGGGIVDW